MTKIFNYGNEWDTALGIHADDLESFLLSLKPETVKRVNHTRDTKNNAWRHAEIITSLFAIEFQVSRDGHRHE